MDSVLRFSRAYSYVSNNPLKYIDPSGQQEISSHRTTILIFSRESSPYVGNFMLDFERSRENIVPYAQGTLMIVKWSHEETLEEVKWIPFMTDEYGSSRTEVPYPIFAFEIVNTTAPGGYRQKGQISDVNYFPGQGNRVVRAMVILDRSDNGDEPEPSPEPSDDWIDQLAKDLAELAPWIAAFGAAGALIRGAFNNPYGPVVAGSALSFVALLPREVYPDEEYLLEETKRDNMVEYYDQFIEFIDNEKYWDGNLEGD